MLPDRHRATLAAFFGVGEEELGGAAAPSAMMLPRLDVFASAGPGALVDTETLIGTEAIDPALARTLDLKPGMAAIVRVRGDSMEPGLLDGDISSSIARTRCPVRGARSMSSGRGTP